MKTDRSIENKRRKAVGQILRILIGNSSLQYGYYKSAKPDRARVATVGHFCVTLFTPLLYRTWFFLSRFIYEQIVNFTVLKNNFVTMHKNNGDFLCRVTGNDILLRNMMNEILFAGKTNDVKTA